MKKLTNLFHCNADNIGDRMSGPSQYLWPAEFQSAPINQGLSKDIVGAIVGGGQIFQQLRRITEENSMRERPTKLIAWGIGLPLRGSHDNEVRGVAQKCAMFSTRNYDWKEVLEFVPCASCLSPSFDICEEPKHELVIYMHRRKPGPTGIPKGIPTLTNAVADLNDAIQFISSGDTVVTNSYHGVYWAQLLGRRVVCVPYNHKFFTFESPPVMADVDTWRSAVPSTRRTRPMLEEYRSLNRKFALGVERALHE